MILTPARRRPGARHARLSGVLPAGMWTREWLVTLARPRAVVMKLAIPLLLAVPLVTGGAPTFWSAMLLSVLVAMLGAVGAGVALARGRSEGLLARLAVVPRSPSRIVGAWVLASASVDAVQLLPVVAVALAAGSAAPGSAAALLLIVGAVLLVTNTLGCALALLAGTAGEVLLDVAVVLAPMLFLGGLFTGVPRTGWRWWAAQVDPFAYLHSAFIQVLGGTPAFGPLAVVAAAAVSSAVALVALALLSRRLLDRA